jgi:hypothetical protein
VADESADAPKIGRPSGFNIWTAHEICERIATTARGIDFICESDDSLPSARTVHNWLNAHPGFLQSYLRARERQADLLFDECLEIADDSTGDTKTVEYESGASSTQCNSEWISRSKLRVDTRLRMAGKLSPKKYGERQTVEHTDPQGNNPFSGLMEAVASNGRPRPATSD